MAGGDGDDKNEIWQILYPRRILGSETFLGDLMVNPEIPYVST
jgi:hypothetical protein